MEDSPKEVNTETLLIIDDDEIFRESLKVYLSELNCNIIDSEDGQKGLAMLEKIHPDLVITELKTSDIDGLDILKKANELDDQIPIIVITGNEDLSMAIEAMQLHAFDYLKKPFDINSLIAVTRKALDRRKLTERIAISLSENMSEYNLENSIIGNTKSMYDIVKKIGVVSMNHVGVLIQGESGTGKELIAKTIHYSGITKCQPFVAVNCSALTETLLESELFGHVKGAFTGAIKDKKGKFELAGEGTIFLDEISEISPAIQVKLLRVLQEKEFDKVGGESTIKMKARVIAATNRNLLEMVNKGQFREDLYYRLNIVRVDVPPLRERKEDIPVLAVHLLRKINQQLHKNVCKIPFDVLEILMDYKWIGNVRELENILLQAVVLSKSDVLEKDTILLRKEIHPFPATAVSGAGEAEHIELTSLSEAERKHIKNVLVHTNWERRKACQILGITEPTLRKKIREYNLAC